MNANKASSKLRLRPHHILCLQFLNIEPPGRGAAYERASREIIEILRWHEDDEIEVTCGVDDLCRHCPNLVENKCISPLGDEEKVRRWDAKVMEGLKLNCGDQKSVRDLRRLFQQCLPLPFCKECCPWRTICAAPSFGV
ncbi:MAG: DUF1284 domain-containing protein [Desulfobacteraceae bacterium]|nr:DUF1284 domain-containing protein [Desulfobacteraceae bacterium]